MPSVRERLDFLVSSLDFHLTAGRDPVEAWHQALRDYAYVYHADDGRTELSRAAEQALGHPEARLEWPVISAGEECAQPGNS